MNMGLPFHLPKNRYLDCILTSITQKTNLHLTTVQQLRLATKAPLPLHGIAAALRRATLHRFLAILSGEI